jgi:hypothetical protein
LKAKEAYGEQVRTSSPHKYLLYKPSFSQFYAFMSTAFKDTPPHSVLMLYLSADASLPTTLTTPAAAESKKIKSLAECVMLK